VSNGEPFIRAVEVEKTYHLGETLVTALKGITLSLERSDFVALAGSSGSGKTTLLNLIGCLDTPTKGEISIGGRNVSHMTDDELAEFRRTQLGFIFQTFNLLPVLSAVENVEYPLLKIKMTASERRERALTALKRVGLSHVAAHRPDQLSGGQRQRVAIARALVHEPELIIADEPTANLDKATAGEILDLLAELNRSMGLTLIIATHDPLVMARTRRTVHISDGRIAP